MSTFTMPFDDSKSVRRVWIRIQKEEDNDDLSSTQLLSSQRAKRTCPRWIYCAKSRIPGASIAVFTSKLLKPNTFFGPYIGIRHQSSRKADNSTYVWTIEYSNGKIHSYIDAIDQTKSNWLRYVNCTCTVNQEYLIPIQYNSNIFYKTIRIIQPNEELLVYSKNLK
ncbi:unnamed protein product [Rotaria sordida]|uniref:SET domain-containing protein n=1 Tax=Rotaria sordida TaxID=392033 RepID=A0A815ND54_9BILA|nr:unnamed protein product [Rotaria sordida]CAF1431547.1 unnamed protein product [Rotaria sordida]CAF4012163.1 unnamed protein product [Rotaria sordida]